MEDSPASRGRGRGKGRGRGAATAGARGAKRELAGLTDSLSSTPSSSKLARRGAAPTDLTEAEDGDGDASMMTAAVNATQYPVIKADNVEQAPIEVAVAPVAPTPAAVKKRIIESSEDEDDNAGKQPEPSAFVAPVDVAAAPAASPGIMKVKLKLGGGGVTSALTKEGEAIAPAKQTEDHSEPTASGIEPINQDPVPDLFPEETATTPAAVAPTEQTDTAPLPAPSVSTPSVSAKGKGKPSKAIIRRGKQTPNNTRDEASRPSNITTGTPSSSVHATAPISPAAAVGSDSDDTGSNSTSTAASGLAKKKKLLKKSTSLRKVGALSADGVVPSTSTIPAVAALSSAASTGAAQQTAGASSPVTAAPSPVPSASGSGTVLKRPKAPIKPPGLLKAKPKPIPTNKLAPAPAADFNIFDSLFSGTIASTDHEKQLQKEREEKQARIQKEKEREMLEKRKALSAAAAASASAAALNSGNVSAGEGSDSGIKGKSQLQTKPGLPSFVKPSGKSSMSLLQQRYGGHDQSRKQEIAAMRAQARKKREETAQAGGFDLLAQGVEMSSFETPFLRDWNSHQTLVFSGQGRVFPFYAGGPPRDEDSAEEAEEEEGQMVSHSSGKVTQLPHPWTFGAAFAFIGSAPAHSAVFKDEWK